MAVEGGHCDCVDVLIEEGASVDLPRHDGRGPLLLACLAGNENIAWRLVLAGADVDVQERVSLKGYVQKTEE